MKTLLTSFCILVVMLNLGTIQAFAQEKQKLKEIVIIKFLIPNREEFAKVEIPIPRKYNESAGFKAVSISECMSGKPEECKDVVYSSYDVSVESARLSKNSTQIAFKIEVTSGCKTRKTFTVSRYKKTKTKLRCGVTFIAYYGYETKETN